ncbi:hypothetical protein IFM89_035862 [Coptis chinensis]|uniref:Alpha/beta hydrolase fold-3 domain-containing protein n=1 Tax=Coptis chinensis TaxID=261450 RepID=A0A835LG33_9MAGN|nr:hypothetical protein IFM89_035862 [Coptis chinensis]
MASTPVDILWEYDPFMRVYKDGQTGVSIEDVKVYNEESVLSARLYLPKGANPQSKLPLLIYFHGGGFCIESAFCATYHNYLNLLVEKANVVAVSINYRRASEHPLPIAYEDSWTAVRWVFSQQPKESSPPQEEWLKDYANFDQVYMAGDSAGANIAHHMGVRAAYSKFNGKFSGIVIVHPYFLGVEPIEGEVDMEDLGKLWFAVQTTKNGYDDPSLDDPYLNPVKDPNFSKLACKRVLVCVTKKDALIHRGKLYYENLKNCEWEQEGGVAEIMESKGEGHVFHTSRLTGGKSDELMKKVVAFINAKKPAKE